MTTRLSVSTLALCLLLVPNEVHADPSALCCFEGPAGACDDPSEAGVCAEDPYCCNVAWDSICVWEFQLYNLWPCPPIFEGNYTTGGDVEISEFGGDACGAEPGPFQWTTWFDLPANRTVGSTSQVVFYTDIYDEDEGAIIGGGGDAPPMQIIYNQSGVIRGRLDTDWYGDLEGACSDTESVLYEIRPRSTKSCFTTSLAPGCNTPSIETWVCHYDSYCCTTAWDSACVFGAQISPW